MDEELIADICYNYEVVLGFIKIAMPDAYENYFNIEKTWTQEEFAAISKFAIKSEQHKNAMEKLLDKLNQDIKKQTLRR